MWSVRCVVLRVGETRDVGVGQRLALLTSTQLSSFNSGPSSLVLEPLTATLLLGGARSSALLMAGLFLSSILDIVDGRGEAEGVVTAGIRSRVTPADVSERLRCALDQAANHSNHKSARFCSLVSSVAGRGQEAGWAVQWLMGENVASRARSLKFRGSKSQTKCHGLHLKGA